MPQSSRLAECTTLADMLEEGAGEECCLLDGGRRHYCSQGLQTHIVKSPLLALPGPHNCREGSKILCG